MAFFLRSVALGAFLSAASGANTGFDQVVLRQALSHPDASAARGAVSADGRFVAFVSMAQLLPADRNVVGDIYVLDRRTHAITLETSAADGGPSNGTSAHPQLSGDGRHLAFESMATNLTMGKDHNELQDVFVRDRVMGTTRRVSIGRLGEPDGNSDSPAISGDGRFVAFASSATNLVMQEDANGLGADVYLFCLETGTTTRGGVDTAGRAYASAFAPRLSGDGRLVVFTATERAPERARAGSAKLSGRKAVYFRDTTTAVTTCISCFETWRAQSAFAPDISADGRIVVFTLLTTPHPERTHIVVYDRSASARTVITRHANARNAAPRISADGRWIVFESWASNLLCGKRCAEEDVDPNLLPDVYLFDRATGRSRRISGEHHSWWSPGRVPSIDANGRTVVFSSRQPFGPEDVTIDFDLYVCTPACD